MTKLAVHIVMLPYQRVPPDWLVWVLSKMLQTMLCVQVLFLGVTMFKLTWALACIITCYLVDIVEDQSHRASLSAVIQRIYFS